MHVSFSFLRKIISSLSLSLFPLPFFRMKFFFLNNSTTKSIGALDLIRKCLTVLPSKRFTVDDIAAHWWINLGYKYPPVHYYLTPAMKRNGMVMPSNVPALTYNQTRMDSISSSKHHPNGDTPSKSKPTINGYYSVPLTRRSNRNHEKISTGSRRTSKERPTEGFFSKNPPRI